MKLSCPTQMSATVGLISGSPDKEFSIADNIIDKHWQSYASIYILLYIVILTPLLYYLWC